MRVEIKAERGVWAIRCTDGQFKGKTLATAESLSLSDVWRRGKVLVGTLTASWGTTVMRDDLDDFTRLNLVGRRAFNYDGCQPLGNFKAARRVIVNGSKIVGC